MIRLIVGIFCFLISVFGHNFIKWELRTWAISPLPRPESALILSGEFAPLTGDFFLVKAAVFYSEVNQKNPEETLWLARAIYLASYLDPYYFEPYWTAGVLLPWEGRIEEARAILTRGLKYLPQRWEIPFYLGFISFYFEHDNREAARYFLKASRLPDSPAYLPLLATRLAVKGSETRMAIAFLEQELQEVEDEKLKERLLKRLTALKAILYLEETLKQYKQRYGRLPVQLEDLVKKRLIPRIPPDPYGGKFYLTETGRIWSTSNLR